MNKKPSTLKQKLLYIKYVKAKLFAHPERYKEFEELKVKYMLGKIPLVCFSSSLKYLLKYEPDSDFKFKKVSPRKHQPPQDDEKNQEPGVRKSEVALVENSAIHACLDFVNRVIKAVENNNPGELLPKFFDLMEEYRNDLDQEKLKQGWFSLFEFYPEFDSEFMQFIEEEPTSLEGIMERFDKKMVYIDVINSNIQSAIENTLKLVDECGRSGRRTEVTKFLSGRNLEDIMEYCNVDLEKSRNVRESAYVVVGKLSWLLEKRKKDGDAIRRKMVDEVEKFQEGLNVMSRPRATMSEGRTHWNSSGKFRARNCST